jgi:hypothetical protein
MYKNYNHLNKNLAVGKKKFQDFFPPFWIKNWGIFHHSFYVKKFKKLIIINFKPSWNRDSFTGEFLPNPYLKNMISTYRKDFHKNKWPKFTRHQKNKSTNQLPDFYY